MADPDTDRPTEIALEMEQRKRLLDMFSLVETYDGRESVIAFCEALVSGGKVD